MTDQNVIDLIQTVIILYVMYDHRMTKREVRQLEDRLIALEPKPEKAA